MPKNTQSYEEDLLSRLRDPEYALIYLNALLDDEEEDADASFLLGLRDVAKAHQISHVAEATGLNRESLYKMLSESGNPSLRSLRLVLNALGLRITIGNLHQEETRLNHESHVQTGQVVLVNLGDEGACPISTAFRDVVAGQSFPITLGRRTFEPAKTKREQIELRPDAPLITDPEKVEFSMSA